MNIVEKNGIPQWRIGWFQSKEGVWPPVVIIIIILLVKPVRLESLTSKALRSLPNPEKGMNSPLENDIYTCP